MTVTQDRSDHTAALPAPRSQTLCAASWRDLLEARWRDRLQDLTESCLAFHEAGLDALADQPHASLRRLMRRAVAARQALADTDEAMRRLSDGRFGRCEDCSGTIPADSLRIQPEMRYCSSCLA